jgi:hypothetical protein
MAASAGVSSVEIVASRSKSTPPGASTSQAAPPQLVPAAGEAPECRPRLETEPLASQALPPSKTRCLPLTSAAGEPSFAAPSLSFASRAIHPSPSVVQSQARQVPVASLSAGLRKKETSNFLLLSPEKPCNLVPFFCVL